MGEGIQYVTNPGIGIFGGFATIMFAYNSHSSAVALVSGLKDKSASARTRLVTTTSLIATVFYCVFIVSAYLTIGKDITQMDVEPKVDNLLAARPTSLPYQIGAVAVAIECMFSYPILMYPARSSLIWLFSLYLNRFTFWRSSKRTRVILTVSLIIGIMLPIGIFFKSALGVLKLISAVFGSLIMLIIPSLFVLKIRDEIEVRKWEKFGLYFNIALGIVVIVGGIIDVIVK